MKRARGFACVGILTLLTLACQAQNRQPATIVFVCEHGSAKSVIATAHFNRLAEAKGLPYRAVSRGTHPDTEIPALIRTGLLADGLDVSGWKPKLISDDDMRQAARVITRLPVSCQRRSP
jgi:arsenate reductase